MFRQLSSLLLLIVGLSFPSAANNLTRDINEEGDVKSKSLLSPYGFYNENTGGALALVYANTGRFQPQSTSLINAFVGSNDTYSIYSALKDIQITYFDRLFVDGSFIVSDWGI